MTTTLRVLQFGDCHLDRPNLDLTLPALREIVAIAEREKPDLAIMTGDAFVRRGHLDPEAVLRFRQACEKIAASCRFGLIAVDGNHDLLFDGSVSSLYGALAGTKAPQSESLQVYVASEPQAFVVSAKREAPAEAILLAIPTIDRFRVAQYLEGADPSLPRPIAEQAAAEAAIMSLVAEAKGKAAAAGVPLIVAYHGSISGAVLGNETMLRTGIDVQVRASTFAGADLVCLGHIHKAQQVYGSPPLWYNGPIAPLSWGEDTVEPVALLHEIVTSGGAVAVLTQARPIPVVSQMLEGSLTFDSSDNPLEDLRSVLFSGGIWKRLDSLEGARVRLTLRGPRSVLGLLRNEDVESVFADLKPRDVSLIREATDDVQAKIEVGDRKVDLVEALRLWYGLRPPEARSDEELERLDAFAREVEARVRDEDLDACYDFRPLGLRLRNWTQFAEVDLDLASLSGIVAVRGANTAGKSNLVRAIPFALYELQEAGDVLSDLIRHGTEEASVVLDFASRGQIYRITRKLRRGKNRSASQTLILERYEQGPGEAFDPNLPLWRIHNGADKAETQQRIEKLVGSRELFEGTVYAGQDSVSALLGLRPAEMKDLLGTVLHRDFASRVQIAAGRRAKAEAEIEEKSAALRELEAAAYRAASLRQELAVNGQELATKREVLAEAEGSAEECRRHIELADAELARLRVDADRGEQAQAELSAARDQLRRLRADEKRIEEARQELASVCADLEALGSFPEPDPAVDAELDAAGLRIQEQQAATLDDLAERSVDLEKKDADLRLRRQAQDEQARQIRAKLERCQKDADLLSSVPCGGKAWVDLTGKNPVDMGSCRFTAEARERVARKGELQESLDRCLEFCDAIAEEGAQVMRAREELRRLTATTREEFAERTRELSAALDRQRKVRQAYEGATRARRELELRRAALEEASRGDLEAVKAEIRDVLLILDDLAQKVTAAAEASAAVVGAVKRGRELRTSLGAFSASIDLLRIQIEELVAVRGRVEGALEAADEQSSRGSELSEEMARARSAIRIFSLYESACGRDGIPFLLLERFAIPQIAEAVNLYLAPTGFRVDVESDRLSVTAGVKSGVYFSFSDSRGRHPVSSSSGFQAIAIGSGLRNSLADVHAAATGTRLRCAIQDEGFGAYDADNIIGARETIRQIADRRELFVFVSHVGGLNEIADWIIDVSAQDGRSTVKVSRGA